MQKNILLICLILISQKSISQNNQQPNTSLKDPDSLKSKIIPDKEIRVGDNEAEFPGGDKKWTQYLKKNINPNVPVTNNAPVGAYTVTVMFSIRKDGSIKYISPRTNFGYGMEAELIRVITQSESWIPATKDGKAVNAYRQQSAYFKVADK